MLDDIQHIAVDEHAVHVGQEYHNLRAQHGRHQRCDHVVVAEADLIDSHRVVFVDDRQHAAIRQRGQRVADIQISRAVLEVIARQQHLGNAHATAGECIVKRPHQLSLPDRRAGLEHGQRFWPGRE